MPNESSPSASDANRPDNQFQLGRILKIVLPLALLLIGGGLFWGYFDGPKMIREWMQPARVVVTGQVLMDGEPLSGGEVATMPTTPGLKGASGFLDKDGKFSLKMDIRGTFIDGAFVGEHKVTVWKFDPNSPSGPRQPDLLTGREFFEFSTTPLKMTVTKDPSQNNFTFNVTKAAKPEPKGRPGGPGGGGPPGGGPRKTPAEQAQELIEKNDGDGDKKLNTEEARKVTGPVGVGLQSADKDADGLLDAEEIAATIEQLEASNARRSFGMPKTEGKGRKPPGAKSPPGGAGPAGAGSGESPKPSEGDEPGKS